MAGYQRSITFSLPAAVTNGICLSQTRASAGALTLNGSLVSGGVASLVTSQRVGIAGTSNNSAVNFTIVGTGTNGLSQTEVLAGPNNNTVNTTHDFLTVTSITSSAAITGNITVGTVAIGSSNPFSVDPYVNPTSLGVDTTVSGTVNYTIEFTTADLSPLWDLNSNTPTWFGMFGFIGATAGAYGKLDQPCTLARITINSGTGTVVARFRQSLIGKS